jgi:hypothetical protein
MNQSSHSGDGDEVAIGVPEADAMEQRVPVDDDARDIDEEDDAEAGDAGAPLEADPVDVAEQSVSVPIDEGDRDAVPRRTD